MPPKYRTIDIETQHNMFTWYALMGNKLVKIPKPIHWGGYVAHHYVKEQQYFKDQEKYRYIQKFILLTNQEHLDVHNMSNDRFLGKYGIERSKLIYLGG